MAAHNRSPEPLPDPPADNDTPPVVAPPRRRPSRRQTQVVAGALVLVLAIGAGYLAGSRGTATPTPAAAGAPSSTAPPVGVAGRLPITPLRPATPPPTAVRNPVSIEIPAIEVSGDLVGLGLNPDGTLEVPTDYARVGWYEDGPRPGQRDKPPVVIAGHVDNGDGPAVFYDLNTLTTGDEVRLRLDDGSTAVYVVYAAAQYAKDKFPENIVYAPRDESEIVLITCTGPFDSAERSYLDNYVISARLDPTRSTPAAP